jgi:hypothetical protein
VPSLLLRPLLHLKKFVIGFLKSMLFAGGYILILRRTICFFTEHWHYSSTNGAIGAFLGGITLKF